MATGGDWTLDDSTIVQLAADISINDMVTVAESYMKISSENIKNLRDENRGSAEAVNREILSTWIYRFPGPHHRLVSTNHTVIITGGSKWGCQARAPSLASVSFIFKQGLGKIDQIEAFQSHFWSLCLLPQEILYPPLIIIDRSTRCSAYNAYFSRYRSDGFEIHSL